MSAGREPEVKKLLDCTVSELLAAGRIVAVASGNGRQVVVSAGAHGRTIPATVDCRYRDDETLERWTLSLRMPKGFAVAGEAAALVAPKEAS